MGALSNHGGEFFYKLMPTTNAIEVEAFFIEMAEKYNMSGSVVIMDNHRAHLSRRVKELFQELQCQLFFLPVASSNLNPIETVWSHLKRKWRSRLLEYEVKLMTHTWMERELTQILADFNPEELENLARSHYSEVICVLSEAVAHHDSIPDIFIN